MVAHLLLVAALTVPVSAQKPPDCIHVSPKSARYKADLDAVRDCQEKARQKMIDDARSKGKPLSSEKLDQIDDQLRAQVREFMAKSGAVIKGGPRSGPALGAVTDEDLERVSPKEAAEIEGLENRLRSAAGDGKDGITPAMARDIIDSLTKEQGFINQDMKDLIDSVARDGGKLTPETMKKLQDAGRAAKAAGLDLNIDKNVEKDLLEHDFDKDRKEKPGAYADPGNM